MRTNGSDWEELRAFAFFLALTCLVITAMLLTVCTRAHMEAT